MNKSESIKNIAGALLVAQKTMGDATKGSKNPFFKSSYADLNSIREVAIPALNAQGISVIQPTKHTAAWGPSGQEGSFVETVLLHVSGEWISGTTRVVNTKGDAQGEGSGISYARRYGLQSLLNIGAVDDDGEAAVGRKNEKAQEVVTTPKAVNGTVSRVEPATRNSEVPKTETKLSDSNTAKSKVQTRPNRDVIAEAFKKLEAEKKVTKETFKTKYLSGAGLSTINDTQAAIAVIKIQTDFPGVI